MTRNILDRVLGLGLVIGLAITMNHQACAADQALANLGQLKTDLKNYYANAYQRDFAASLKDVEPWLRERSLKVKMPAIVLDIDETSLSNWPEIEADDFAYIPDGDCAFPPKMPCGSTAWERSARGIALEPTLKVFQLAVKLKIAVFFITGRLEDPAEQAATELNLWKVGFRGWEQVILRPNRTGTVTAYKSGKRADIEGAGYTIIANIGDQQSDLDGGHAEKTFKVPNPFYYIP